jgi:hypothetical protein
MGCLGFKLRMRSSSSGGCPSTPGRKAKPADAFGCRGSKQKRRHAGRALAPVYSALPGSAPQDRTSQWGCRIVAAAKPYRRASEQFNIRATPEEAALIRAAFPHRTINKIAVELLVAEARARLASQGELSDATVERRTEAA